MKKRKGVFIKDAGEENEVLGKQFLKSPTKFAEIYGLNPKKLECPKMAHKALERGQAMVSEVEKAGIVPTDKSMPKLRRIARKHLGKNYIVSLIPFGLKFRERIDSTKLDVTGTASGTITWLDTDADVDS